MPKRRPKTPQELKEDMRNFDRACNLELAKALRRTMERIVMAGRGERLPPKYKMKFPRFTRTVVD